MNLHYTGRFKRDFKRMIRRGRKEDKLWDIVSKLLKGKQLPAGHQDHALLGNWEDRRECHIEADWLLIYCVRHDDLILERTGTHSDLFR